MPGAQLSTVSLCNVAFSVGCSALSRLALGENLQSGRASHKAHCQHTAAAMACSALCFHRRMHLGEVL